MSKLKYNYFLQKAIFCKWCSLLLLFILCLGSCRASKPPVANEANLPGTYTISGSVVQTSSYCGGANPPKELLRQMATPVPYAGKQFYIKSGNENDLAMPVITSFMTDSIGNFSIHLTPGIYSIVVKEQLTVLNAADFDTKKLSVDKDCLAAWWKKPYYLLEVKQENISTLNFVFHHRCNIKYDIPCISYHGPLAP